MIPVKYTYFESFTEAWAFAYQTQIEFSKFLVYHLSNRMKDLHVMEAKEFYVTAHGQLLFKTNVNGFNEIRLFHPLNITEGSRYAVVMTSKDYHLMIPDHEDRKQHGFYHQFKDLIDGSTFNPEVYYTTDYAYINFE